METNTAKNQIQEKNVREEMAKKRRKEDKRPAQ